MHCVWQASRTKAKHHECRLGRRGGARQGLVGRYPGAGGARKVAAGDRLDHALRCLAATPYARYARTVGGLPEAQGAVTATLPSAGGGRADCPGAVPACSFRRPPDSRSPTLPPGCPHRTVVARRARSRTGSGRWRLSGGARAAPPYLPRAAQLIAAPGRVAPGPTDGAFRPAASSPQPRHRTAGQVSDTPAAT